MTEAGIQADGLALIDFHYRPDRLSQAIHPTLGKKI